MGAYGVGDVTDVDGVQVLVVARLLNKDLGKSRTKYTSPPQVCQFRTWIKGPHPGHKQYPTSKGGGSQYIIWSCPQ